MQLLIYLFVGLLNRFPTLDKHDKFSNANYFNTASLLLLVTYLNRDWLSYNTFIPIINELQ